MRKPAANIVRISCLVLILTGLAVQPASGYTLVDWIRTWPASAPGAAPAQLAPAVMPIFSSPAPSCGTPVPNCGTPAPACDARPPYYTAPPMVTPAPNCGAAMPAAPVGAGVSYLQPAPTMAVPVQQVRYRTTWVRTPTTNYRPIVTYDPATGWPTTAMQPCTTYTWQLRRVPTNGQGGWFSNTFGNLFGPPYPPPAQPVGIYVPAPAPVVTPGWVGSPTPAVPATPAYPAPPSAAPCIPYGSPAPLSSPAPSSGWVPSGSSPTPPATPGMPAPPSGTGSAGHADAGRSGAAAFAQRSSGTTKPATDSGNSQLRTGQQRRFAACAATVAESFEDAGSAAQCAGQRFARSRPGRRCGQIASARGAQPVRSQRPDRSGAAAQYPLAGRADSLVRTHRCVGEPNGHRVRVKQARRNAYGTGCRRLAGSATLAGHCRT